MGEWLCSREMKKAAHQILFLSIVTHKKVRQLGAVELFYEN